MPKHGKVEKAIEDEEVTEFEVLEDGEPGDQPVAPPGRSPEAAQPPLSQQPQQQQQQQPQGQGAQYQYQYPYPQYQGQYPPQSASSYPYGYPYPQYQYPYPYPYGYPPYQYPPQYPAYGYYPPSYYPPPETPKQAHIRKKRHWTNPLVLIAVLVLAFIVTIAISVPIMVAYFVSKGPTSASALNEAFSSPSFLLVMTVIQNMCFAGLVYLLYVNRGLFSFKEMGLHTVNLNRSIVIGLIVGGMLFLVSAFVFPSINNALDPNGQDSVNDPITQGMTTPTNIAIVFVLVSVVAPLGEEFFFRGLLFKGSKFFFDSGNWGKDMALIVSMAFSGILFGVVHFYGIAGTLLIFGLGMLLAYVCHHTDGLVAPMLIHALYNAGVIIGVLAF